LLQTNAAAISDALLLAAGYKYSYSLTHSLIQGIVSYTNEHRQKKETLTATGHQRPKRLSSLYPESRSLLATFTVML